MTAFDTAWAIFKSDFYYNGDDPLKEGGKWVGDGWTPNHNPEKYYYTGVNLNHPIYQFKDWLKGKEGAEEKLSEDDTIKRILETIMHEEGHEAVIEPLTENMDRGFEEEGYEPTYFSESIPPNRQQEYGAMLVEGMSHDDIMAELRRRNF
jgi:hypothetical protein